MTTDTDHVEDVPVEDVEHRPAGALAPVPIPTAGSGLSLAEYLDRVASKANLDLQRQLSERWDEFCDAMLSPNDYVEVKEKGKTKRYKRKSAWKKGARFFGISVQVLDRKDNGWRERDAEGNPHFTCDVLVRAIAPWGQYAEDVGSCDTRETRFMTEGAVCPACGGPMWDNREERANEPGWKKKKRAEGKLPAFECKDKDVCGLVIAFGEPIVEKVVTGRAPNLVARAKARHDCYGTAITRAANRAISALIAAGEVSAEEVEHANGSEPYAPEEEDQRPEDERAAERAAQNLARADAERDPPTDDQMNRLASVLDTRDFEGETEAKMRIWAEAAYRKEIPVTAELLESRLAKLEALPEKVPV